MSKQLIICVQQRYAPNPVCCVNNGSLELLPLFKKSIAELKIPLELVASGCLGMCLKGPNLKLLPEGRVWNAVQKTQIEDIVRQAGGLSD